MKYIFAISTLAWEVIEKTIPFR